MATGITTMYLHNKKQNKEKKDVHLHACETFDINQNKTIASLFQM